MSARLRSRIALLSLLLIGTAGATFAQEAPPPNPRPSGCGSHGTPTV